MSKELECFKRIKKYSIIVDYEKDIVKFIEELLPNSCREVEQALIKAQEQEKVLSIIFEKNVSIFWVRECKNVEEYNYNIPDYLQLTEEEFELLKRWLNESK